MNNANDSRGWDLHAHLIPGVDDGVRTDDEALEAIAALQSLGYEGCVVTPHIYRGVHDNDTARLKAEFDRFRSLLSARGVRFGLELAAEYFADDQLIELAERQELLSFGGARQRFVLVEFPYIGAPLGWADILSAVSRSGYRVVIAHPERYRYFAADTDRWLDDFSAYSVLYQCEIGSLSGQYGNNSRDIARQFLKAKRATFWGTDLHRPSHVERFIRPGLRHLAKGGQLNPLLVSDDRSGR